jgi:hypothetical protein
LILRSLGDHHRFFDARPLDAERLRAAVVLLFAVVADFAFAALAAGFALTR